MEQRNTTLRCKKLVKFLLCISTFLAIEQWTSMASHRAGDHQPHQAMGPILLSSAHVVLTRDDQGGSLVLTGEDGKGEGGDQLVIAGNQMGGGGGGGQDTRMVMQDAANREGDIVMSGKSMIIPGEDGHIVLADSRSRSDNNLGPHGPPPANPFFLWAPYMNDRYFYRMMPYFGR